MKLVSALALAALIGLTACNRPAQPVTKPAAPAAPTAPPSEPPAPARTMLITDPKAFVTEVYANLAKNDVYAPPDNIYTPRLQSLWTKMVQETSQDEVGAIDFEPWTNAQDWEIKNVVVMEAPVDHHDDRKIVIANFRNADRSETIVFYFEKFGGAWLLDDMSSGGAEGWTLSLLLKYGWAATPDA